jgi:hypothetical protein
MSDYVLVDRLQFTLTVTFHSYRMFFRAGAPALGTEPAAPQRG